MKNLLPIKSPPITVYQQIALPLMVAMLNPASENWFYSNYIQVSCVNRDYYVTHKSKDTALHYNFYNPEITSPWGADHICIEGREQLYLFRNPNFIKDTIRAGWYIYTDADMFYIDGSDTLQNFHYPHDLMIYGYDEENVYIYMYDESKLVSHTVSFEHFIKGYYSEYCDEDWYRNRAILFKPNNMESTVNIERIRWQMHDYINGLETFSRERPNIFAPNSLMVHGFNTYTEFEKLFDYVFENKRKYLRRTDTYCLYEHKKVMFERVGCI